MSVAYSDRRSVHGFLYEGMMSPIARGDFLDGAGFCEEHFRMAKEIEDECWPAGGIGMAILCEDSILRALRVVDLGQQRTKHRRRDGVAFEPGSACTFCRENRRKELSLVEVLEELTEEEEFAQPLAHGRLCLRHTELALQRWANPEKTCWLATILQKKADELHADLREFIRKHDYQFRDEPKGREQDSVRRSAEFLFGSRYKHRKAVP